jgi:hypothetical protein
MNPSSMWHAVITRFSYRHVPNAAGVGCVPPWLLTDDPLDPARLKFRFAVFEFTCAASLLAQTSQDFDWILIIDPQLPEPYRQRLRLLLRNRPRTRVHEYDPTQDLGCADWLRCYMPGGCTEILTTQLDDDDALPANFIETARQQLESCDSPAPRVRIAASRRSDQWELTSGARAPLGYRCSWHRGNWVVSTGLSLLSPAGPGALTVLSLNHQIADIWMIAARGEALRSMLVEKWGLHASRAEDATRFIAGQLDRFQDRIAPLLGNVPSPGPGGFLDLTETVGAVLVANHFLNDQFMRLLEPKADRVRVSGPDSFPNVPVAFDCFREHSPMFRKAWSSYFRLMRTTVPRGRHWYERARLLVWASWRFIRV